MSTFAIQHFPEIPKIVGRGAKAGSGRPPLYPFDQLKNVGDGFPFPSTLVKKVRGALQQYRASNPQKRFVIRPLDASQHACILSEILTQEQLQAHIAAKEAQKAAEAKAERELLANLGLQGSTAVETVTSGGDRAVDSLEDVLGSL